MSNVTSGQGSNAQEQLVSYWQGKCEGARLPSREDIDPTDLADLLRYLVFMDIVYDGKDIRLRYRMTGAAGVDLAQREVTGLWLHDLYTDKQVAYFVNLARSAIESREPVSFDTNMLSPGREFIEVSALGCPLASNGQDVDAIVIVFGPVAPDDQAPLDV